MVEILNTTPLPHLRFSNTDNRGREFGVLMIKAALDIDDSGFCTLSDEQEPFSFTDQCHGEVNVSAVRLPSDLVSYKPKPDLIVDAIAHAPAGEPAPSWLAGIRVTCDKTILAEKLLRVTGQRYWLPQWRRELSEDERRNWRRHRDLFAGWALSEPAPARKVPLRYELAYGGSIRKGQDQAGNEIVEAFEYNPIGRGWLDPEWTDHTVRQPAPQLEESSNPINTPYRHYSPQGFGPVPPAWLPRRKLGGTFDRNWLKNTWPKWPPDYDFAYNNSAARGLVLAEFPKDPLTIQLVNMRHDKQYFFLKIPDITPLLIVDDASPKLKYIYPNLDTILLLIGAEDLFDCRVCLTWRMVFHREDTNSIAIIQPDTEERERLASDPGLLTPPPAPEMCSAPCNLMEKPA